MKKIFLGLLFVLLSQSVHARYFDPEGGRFINRDPLEYVDGMNLYAGYFAQRFQVDPMGTELTEMPPVQEKVDPEKVKKSGDNRAVTNTKTSAIKTKIEYSAEKCCWNLTINGSISVIVYYLNSYIADTVKGHREPTTTTRAHEMRHVRNAQIFWTKALESSRFYEDCYLTKDDATYAREAFLQDYAEALKDKRAADKDYHDDIGQTGGHR